MKLRPTLIGALASTSVLVLGWQIGSAGIQEPSANANGTGGSTPAPDTQATPGTTAAPTTAPETTTPGATTPETPAAPAAKTVTDGTYTGDPIRTEYGTVQVQAVVSGEQIVDVVALKLTDDGPKSDAINAKAIPILRQEVLSAQSSAVAAVSGATYTSDAYLTSLQSALDQAGF